MKEITALLDMDGVVADYIGIIGDFHRFVEENGPSFMYGHVVAPYNGCHWKNCIVFIKDNYAYLSMDLAGSRYEEFWAILDDAELPEELEGNKFLAAGRIKIEDLEEVVSSPSSKEQLEIHPISEIVANTPYALYWPVWSMMNALGYETKGLFTCRCCNRDYNELEGIEYLEGEFKGNGGIGIEVGEPLCRECASERTCWHCGGTGEPEEMNVDEEGHCKYCKDN